MRIRDAEVQPSKNNLKNALGGDLHKTLVEKFDKAWAIKHNTELETSSAELIVCDTCDDEDEEEYETTMNVGLCNPR